MPKHFGHKNNENKSINKNEKLKQKIKQMIETTNLLQNHKQKEADLLKIKQDKLEKLLNECDKIDNKKLKNDIKNISKLYLDSFRKQRKQRKERRKNRQKQRKKAKEEIKKKRKEYYDIISKATINILPKSKSEINNSNVLNIFIDGWNVISTHKLCRKQMRKNKSKAIQIFIKLLNEFINNNNNYDYDMNIKCLFDGNGKNYKDGNTNIEYTGNEISVDDKLVNMFSNLEKNDNKCNLIITSDKELTYKLYQTGVYVMKSSIFYKTYLNKSNNDDDDDDIINNELSKKIAMNMNIDNNDNQNGGDIMDQDEDDNDDDKYTFNDNDNNMNDIDI